MAAILKKKSWYRDYLLIFLGTALMSVALNSAFEPNGLVDGGFSGIAIIIKNITEGLDYEYRVEYSYVFPWDTDQGRPVSGKDNLGNAVPVFLAGSDAGNPTG